MPKLLSSTIKQKKIIIFVVLFLVIFSFVFPQQSLAQESPNFYDGGYAGQEEAEAKYGENCKSGLSWYESIGTGLADIVLAIPKTLADLATWFASYIIARVTDWPITHTDPNPNMKFGSAGANAFINGWSSVRDLANMLVVLGFVIIGIATTLRIRDYEAKKFLLPLILAALLVNFSGLFVGLIIDASTLTMNGLLEEGTEGKMGSTLLSSVKESEKGVACAELRDGRFWGYILVTTQFAFIYLAVAIAFIYLAFILTARYAVLGILFMLSPLAFVFWAFPFPKAKDLWNKWWESFIKWAFIGVGIAFFLNITAQMLATFPLGKEADPTLSTIFFYLTIVLIFLVVGIKITTKTSAIGAAAVMGLASGGIGLAMGAAAGLAKVGGKGLAAGADKMAGGRLSGAGQAISGGVGRTMERMGLRKTGTTASAKSDRVEKEAKLMAAEYTSAKATGDTATVERIRGWAKNRRGVLGGAAMKVVTEAKDLHKAFADPSDPSGKTTDFNALGARLSYAESVGAKDIKKDTQKLMPEVKAYDEPAINEEMQRRNAAGNPLYAQTTAGRAKAAREVVRKQRRSMSVSDIRNMPEPQITADFVEDSNYKTFNRAALEFNTDQHNQAKTLLPELWDRTLAAASVPGATPAVRKAAWKAANKAQRSAWLGALSPADREKADDYLRKIAAINR